MADVKEMRIFSADQILVPDEFPKIMKDFTKEVVRKSPEDIIKFSKAYFESLLKERGYFDDHQTKLNVQLKDFVFHKDNHVTDDYNILGVIGDPSDSKARLGVHWKTGVERAIKMVPRENVEDHDDYMK
mgnify:CR=1 FL=1